MVSYLADKGHRVLANGFNVIPILPGSKAPSIKGWQRDETTESKLNGWVSNGRANHGIGIVTTRTPFADLDISYRPMLRHMVDYVNVYIGFAPVRVGNAPKRGFVFRVKGEPFPKINSREYRDPDGNKAKVEILAEGQQFVSYAIHPDTHKPYRWLGTESPETVTVDELIEVTREQCRGIVDEFHRKADELGWPAWADGGTKTKLRSYENPADDPLGLDQEPLADISDERILATLMAIPNDAQFSERTDWLHTIIFAVSHQTGKSDFGHDVALEWSDEYDNSETARANFEKAWESAGKHGTSRRDITFKHLIKLAKERGPARFKNLLYEAITLERVKELCGNITLLDLGEDDEEALAKVVQTVHLKITGEKLLLKTARKWVKHKAPTSIGGFELSEDGVALAFADRFKDQLKFCQETGQWHHWEGTHWKPEKTQLAFDWARDVCRDLRGPMVGELARASAASAVERFARADRGLVISALAWDTDPWLLGTPAGTVDLRTGILRAGEPPEFISKVTAVAPADIPTPLWLRFLHESTEDAPGYIRFLRQVLGYGLTGLTVEQILVFVYGDGGTGKGVFLNTVRRILGDYATVASMEVFTHNEGATRHLNEVAALRGARLVIASETQEGQAWNEARVKLLTGGEPVTARFLYKELFEFDPQFLLMIRGNNQPMLTNVDDAMRRRVRMAPFDKKPPEKDVQLEEKLRPEFPGILRWMIQGCLDWQKNGLIVPEIVQKATDRYFSEQDITGQWLDECMEIGDYDTSNGELRNSFENFRLMKGIRKPVSDTTFATTLERRGFARIRTKIMRGFNGLRVKDDGHDL